MRGILSVLAVSVLVGCSASQGPGVSVRPPTSVPLTWADLDPSPEEAAWVKDRLASGVPLRVATVSQPGSFEQAPDGTRSGLDYSLVEDFARILGLTLSLKVPDDLSTFFSRNGSIPPDVETNPAEVYTPDLLKTVDLYIGPFSVLPWRERLMTMVPIYPMQNFLAGRRGEEIRSISQLSGKRLAVLKDSMQDGLLRGMAAKSDIQIQFVYAKPQDDLFGMVTSGRADYTLDGGLFFVQNRAKMQGLSLSVFPTAMVRVGWSIKKSDPSLASLVRKFIARVEKNGQFAQWFEASNGTSFTDYMALLTTSEGPAP